MTHQDKLFAKLQALGAGEFTHLNGSLAEHLRGTEALLRGWGAEESVCRAGLFHAVYGTDAIQGELLPLDGREQIVELIGNRAEELTYLYGACNRDAFYPRIGSPAQAQFVDRFMSQEYALSTPQLRDLCEVILANELELASASSAFRAEYGTELCELFERMRGLVSEAGFRAYREVLSGNATALKTSTTSQ